MFSTALYLFFLGVSTLLIQLLGLPLVLAFFGKQPTKPEWWAWGRMTGWLVTGLLIWFTAHLNIPINTTAGFWAVFIGLLLGVYFLFPLQARQRVRQFLRLHWKNILIQEALFLFGLLLLGLIRTFHPAVLDLEKFMNAGLLQGYLRSPTLPAEDFWLAGQPINYYSFGHFLGSLLLRFWHLPVELGFNVLLGWVMGLVLIESFSLGQLLLRKFLPRSKRFSWPLLLAGLTSAALIVFGGNSHPIWYWLTNQTFQGYWYPDVTRFIDHTIHEIPAYSFVVSDLHAHVWSIPIVLMTIFAAWHWLKTVVALKETVLDYFWKNAELAKISIVLGGLLGVLGMTNTWDMVVYGLFLIFLGSLVMVNKPKKLLLLVFSGLSAAVAAMLVIAPWWLHFSSIVTGIFRVTEGSPFWQLAVLWTGHVLISLAALSVVWFFGRKQKEFGPPLLFLCGLGLTSFFFLVLPEVIYFKDIYPTFPRANTMFKFTFQAFIMMSLLAAWLTGFLSQPKTWLPKPIHGALLLLISCFLVGVLTYPFLGYPAYYNRFQTSTDLNGLTWLKTKSPQEYEAIMWLRSETAGRPVVLEAVGDSYSEYARVSTFSGLPTVIGWRAHEWLWRGGFEIPRDRTAEVKTVYEQPESFEAAAILEKYGVQFIFVGRKERETYALDRSGLLTLGEVVFEQGATLIIKRTP